MADNSEKIEDITLGQLLDRAIKAHEEITSAPTPNDASVQNAILSTLSDLTLCASLIRRLAVLSPNETLEDVNTKDLRCFVVEALRGDLETLRKTKGGEERKMRLEAAKTLFQGFITTVDSHEFIPFAQRKTFAGPSAAAQNPALRRESKIAQFKLERELKASLAELRKRREERSAHKSGVLAVKVMSDPLAGVGGPNIASTTLPAAPVVVSANSLDDDSDDDLEEDYGARSFYIAWIRLLYLQAHQELSSIAAELDILGQGAQMSDLPHGPSRSIDDRESRPAEVEQEDLTWRLDRLSTGSGLRDARGPLVSPSGKVLRPFTILPSSSSSQSATRLRLQSEVFREGWRLPTMTVDEYLKEQFEQGNMLSGGGPEQLEQETGGERKRREAEEDNLAGEEKHEELRREKVEWDKFTDVHKKGEGNRMNRG